MAKNSRKSVLEKTLIGPGTYLIFGFMYPWGPWLLTNGRGGPEHCVNLISLELSSVIYFTGLTPLVLFLIPLLILRISSAIYFLLYGVLNLFLLGIWFASMAFLTMHCKVLPYANDLSVPILVITLLSSLLVLFLNRNRMRNVMNINRHVYDFNKMLYSQLAIHIRPDGRSSEAVAFIAYLGALIGVFIVSIPIGDWLNMTEASKDWFMVSLLLFLGFYYAGFLSLNQLYLVYLIHKECKKNGGKMQVKELVKVL